MSTTTTTRPSFYDSPDYRAGQAERTRANWRNRPNKSAEAIERGGIASPVRELRLKLNLTQTEFAEKIGLARSNQKEVSNYENGRKPPETRIAKMMELAAAAGIEWRYTR